MATVGVKGLKITYLRIGLGDAMLAVPRVLLYELKVEICYLHRVP